MEFLVALAFVQFEDQWRSTLLAGHVDHFVETGGEQGLDSDPQTPGDVACQVDVEALPPVPVPEEERRPLALVAATRNRPLVQILFRSAGGKRLQGEAVAVT